MLHGSGVCCLRVLLVGIIVRHGTVISTYVPSVLGAVTKVVADDSFTEVLMMEQYQVRSVKFYAEVIQTLHDGPLPVALGINTSTPGTVLLLSPRGHMRLPPPGMHNRLYFNVTIRALRIGEVYIHFYVTDIHMNKFENITGREWTRLSNSFPVKVESRLQRLTAAMDVAILLTVGVAFVVLGGHVSARQMVTLVKHPVPLLLTLLCRFAVMPAIGLGVSELFGCSSKEIFALVTCIVCPGDGVVCLFVVLMFTLDTKGFKNKKEDITNANTMVCSITLVNCFSTLAFLPIWTMVLETRLFGYPGHVEKLPFRYIISMFVYQSLTLMAGYTIRTRCTGLQKKLESLINLSFVLLVLVVMTIACGILSSVDVLEGIKFHHVSLSLIILIIGFVIGIFITFSLGFSSHSMVVISLHLSSAGLLLPRATLDSALYSPQSTLVAKVPVTLALISECGGLLCLMVYKKWSDAVRFADKRSQLASQDLAGISVLEVKKGKKEKHKKAIPAKDLDVDSLSDIEFDTHEIIYNKETCM